MTTIPLPKPWPIAAPSCVIPATVAENARFLSGRVTEVGLCLFESEACLNYTVADIPSTLTDLPLTWHVHLPTDLPWEAGGTAAAALALAVLHKVSFLAPRLCVLHPPTGSPSIQTALLADFLTAWRRHNALPLLLENVEHCDCAALSSQLFATEEDFGLCLDMGHALGYEQIHLLGDIALLGKTRLVHWSAPGVRDQHLPLSQWTAEQEGQAREIVRRLPRQATHMLEIFHWAGVEASLPLWQKIMEL